MKKCLVEGCNRKYYAKGYCDPHYKQVRNHGIVIKDKIGWESGLKCLVTLCKREAKIKGLCYAHSAQYRKHGKIIREIIKGDGSPICSVEGCSNRIKSNSYCCKHYKQFRTHGKVGRRTRFDMNEYYLKNDFAIMKLYNINGEEVAEALIDKEDMDKCKNIKWSIHEGRNTSYVNSDKHGRLHRFLLGLKNSKPEVDHVNHNGLDNRKDNLRICKNSENSWNMNIPKHNTSGYKGVSWDSSRGKWAAAITKDNKKWHLGRFCTKEEAAMTYDIKAIELFGEYALTNKDMGLL